MNLYTKNELNFDALDVLLGFREETAIKNADITCGNFKYAIGIHLLYYFNPKTKKTYKVYFRDGTQVEAVLVVFLSREKPSHDLLYRVIFEGCSKQKLTIDYSCIRDVQFRVARLKAYLVAHGMPASLVNKSIKANRPLGYISNFNRL